MAKRNREEYTQDIEGQVTSEVATESVMETSTVAGDEKTKPIEEYTDAELLAFIEERKKAKAEAVAIKTVQVPVHKLINASGAPVRVSKEIAVLTNRLKKLEADKGK